MSWFRRVVGLDGFDLLIHFGVTAAAVGFVAASNGPEEMLPVLTGLSLLVLAVRRSIALGNRERRGLTTGEMAAERIVELEQRVEELESAQGRIAELEERLDFAERLLASGPAEQRVGPRLER